MEPAPESPTQQHNHVGETSPEPTASSLPEHPSVESSREDGIAKFPSEEQLADPLTEQMPESSTQQPVSAPPTEQQAAEHLEQQQQAANSLGPTEQHPASFSPEAGPILNMVMSNSSPSSPVLSPRFERAEIDTAAPFESVKEAVSMFGERVDWKSHQGTPISERRAVIETDLHKAHEDLASSREQLANTERLTAKILVELETTKKLVEELTRRLGQDQMGREQEIPHGCEKISESTKQIELEAVSVKDAQVTAELLDVRKEMENVRNELQYAEGARQTAVEQSQEAIAAFGTTAKRVEDLMSELAAANEAVTAAHAALFAAEDQIATLAMEKEFETEVLATGTDKEPEILKQKLASRNSLESKKEEACSMVVKLKEELMEVREAQGKSASSAAEAETFLANVKAELEQAKEAELDAVAALGAVLAELDEVKPKLQQVIDDRSPLSSAMESLRLELERVKVELESMREKEGSACATLASLQEELGNVRDDLSRAIAGEQKAKEAKETLPTAIKLAATQADEAKAAAEVAREEVRKARHEAEEAKAATSTAESRLQAALKEAEAARASEAMAVAEFKAVTESETKSIDPISESEGGGGGGVTISLEEYISLNQKAQEGEEIASRKVAAASAQVEAAKASQAEVQKKLEAASKELETSRHEMQQALRKAEDAQAAKLAAEGELRRWRAEHEQRRKSGSTPLATKTAVAVPQRLHNKPSNGKELIKAAVQEKGLPPSVEENKTLPLDSLSQMLSLKVPPPEKPGKVPVVDNQTKEKVKKKALLTRIASYVMGRKKNQILK